MNLASLKEKYSFKISLKLISVRTILYITKKLTIGNKEKSLSTNLKLSSQNGVLSWLHINNTYKVCEEKKDRVVNSNM